MHAFPCSRRHPAPVCSRRGRNRKFKCSNQTNERRVGVYVRFRSNASSTAGSCFTSVLHLQWSNWSLLLFFYRWVQTIVPRPHLWGGSNNTNEPFRGCGRMSWRDVASPLVEFGSFSLVTADPNHPGTMGGGGLSNKAREQ